MPPYGSHSVSEDDTLLKLLVHELAGNASQEEIKQLQAFRVGDPERYYSLKALASLWNSQPADRLAMELSFPRLMARIKNEGT